MKRVIAALISALAVLSLPVGASADQAESGSILNAEYRGSNTSTVTGSVLCRPEGCDEVALVGAPKQINKERRWRNGRSRVILRSTSCRPKVETYVKFWSKESIGLWRYTVKLIGMGGSEPPYQVLWNSGPLAAGEQPINAEFFWPAAQPCLYLVGLDGYAYSQPAADCLPEFKYEVRKELCAQDYKSGVLAKSLSRVSR
jgi:hypothetical protein